MPVHFAGLPAPIADIAYQNKAVLYDLLFKVSAVDMSMVESEVTVTLAPGEKCERCWLRREDVGQDPEHRSLCRRCAEVVRTL